MFRNYSLLCLFGILSSFLTSTVGREAIVGGYTGSISEIPYQVSVHVANLCICGGGIIGERFVLTAAQCILNNTRLPRSNRIFVIAGTANLMNTSRPAVTVRVGEFFFPMHFHPTMDYKLDDITVLKLVESLPLEHHRNLGKLKLPKNHETYHVAKVSGYGYNHYRKTGERAFGSTDGKLRYASADVLRNDECERDFSSHAIETSKHLCATIFPPMYAHPSNSFGVCTGDVGNPLVENGRIIGILSKIAHHCDEQHSSGIYTRVSSYVGLINSIMQRGGAANMISFVL